MSKSNSLELSPAANSNDEVISPATKSDADQKRMAAISLENAAMLQVNMQIENENERLAVVGQQLIIPQKLQKQYKQQIQNTPAYLEKLDKLTIRIDQHRQSLVELEQRYMTSFESGLSSKEASVRLRRRGHNIISNRRTLSVTESLSQFIFSSSNGLVVTAACLLVISYFVSVNRSFLNLWLLLPLGVSVIVTTLASHYRSTKSNTLGSVASDYRSLTSHKVSVIRDGIEITVKAFQLVSGDICLLSAGTRVPADMRIIQGSVTVDQSLIVGSTAVVSKEPKCRHSSPFEAENILFLGTQVVGGSCNAMVFNCGDKSTLGKLSHQMEVYSHYDSWLMADVKFFYKRVVAFAVFFSVFFGIIGQWSSRTEDGLADKGSRTLLLVSGIIVSTIPLLFNVILVFGLWIFENKMKKNGIFFSKLDSINSFASIGAICISSPDILIDTSARSVVLFEPKKNRSETELANAVFATCLSEDRLLLNFVDDRKSLLSSIALDAPTVESSTLLVRTYVHGIEYIRGSWEDIHALTSEDLDLFEDARRRVANGNTVFAYASREVSEGAQPQVVGIVAISNPVNEATVDAVNQIRQMGIKLVPLCHSTGRETIEYMSHLISVCGIKPISESDSAVHKIFAHQEPDPGLIGDADDDPVDGEDESEEEAVDAGTKDICVVPKHVIDEIRGVKQDIADSECIVPLLMQGPKLAVLSAHKLSELLRTARFVIAFFNVSFIQKLRGTVALKRNCTVGFIGCVNGDTPALRAADIGISITTDGIVSRASDVLVARPDVLPALAESILLSRRCVNNIRRAVLYLLSQIVPRLSPLLMTLAFAYPLPLSVALIITCSLLIDLPIAIGLLLEPAELDVSHRFPRNERAERLISLRMLTVGTAIIGVVASLAGFLGYHQTFADHGFKPAGLPGLGNSAFVIFGPSSMREPGFPPTTGYPLDLSLEVLDNLHLCGRVGEYATLTPAGLAGVPIAERCAGELFSLDYFNRYCYANNRTETYSPTRQATVALFEQQKLAAGVLFKRDELGLPECGTPNRDGIFIPRGFFTQGHQTTVDHAMQGAKCSLADTRCFTNVVLSYAQTAYFTNIAFFGAFAAFLVLRTELFSFFHIGFINENALLPIGCLLSIALVLCITFIPALQNWFGTRSVGISSLFCPAMPFIILIFFTEELRKTHIRRNSSTGRWLMERTMW